MPVEIEHIQPVADQSAENGITAEETEAIQMYT